MAGKKAAGLGTFAGVFTPSILTILGLVLFLRLSFVVGNGGILWALGIIVLANIISLLTSFSLAAIATHLKVKAGGDYYLISRTLGLGYGGAIGIVLFAAQSISVGFYCVGFAEAAVHLAGIEHPFAVRTIAGTVLLLLMGLAWLGADWATRFQYVVMAFIAVAFAAFVAGSIGHWEVMTFEGNLSPRNDAVSFWALFAVFFPAVTGFTQGVSMSGDLRNPGRSIPLGTFTAVALSFVIYLASACLFGGAASREALADDIGAMKHIAAWPALIDAGVFAATLSSALASFLGAPRILQSLARDRIFPLLQPFAKGAGPSANPRRAVFLTGAVALTIVSLGDLNTIASIVSMFFLLSYGILNYATYYEARARSPSFRPRFTLYHERISQAGAIACLAVMLLIDPFAGSAAAICVTGIYFYVRARGLPTRWSDSRRSHHLQQARDHMIAAARAPQHPRDWRPQSMVFSDSTERRPGLIRFAQWIEGGTGLVTVVRVIELGQADLLSTRNKALDELSSELEKLGSYAFPLVVASESLDQAIAISVQSADVGPMGVNTIIVNLSAAIESEYAGFGESRYGQNLRTALALGHNLLVLDASTDDWESLRATPREDRRIDIWWTKTATSALTLVLAHLMTRDKEWEDAEIRVLVAGEDTGGRFQAVREILTASNIDAEIEAVGQFSHDTVIAFSRDTSLVFLPLTMPATGPFTVAGFDPEDVLDELKIVVLGIAADDIELTMNPDAVAGDEIIAAADAIADAARKLAKLIQRERAVRKKLDRARRRRRAVMDQGASPDGDEQALLDALDGILAARRLARERLSEAETRAQELDALKMDADPAD
ncbi:MAG: hypothetical protein IT566_15700 [Rhodospirillaceae bacterium]|nr:hypothetical protein [Rhodospirillaceae bacterium]